MKTHKKLLIRHFYVHYTTHRDLQYSFTSHPKDEAIMVKCLAQEHKRRDRPGRDSKPHSDNTRTWVQCTTPLGHDTPRHTYKNYQKLLLSSIFIFHVYSNMEVNVKLWLICLELWVPQTAFLSLNILNQTIHFHNSFLGNIILINPPTFGTFFIQVDAPFKTIHYCGFEW